MQQIWPGVHEKEVGICGAPHTVFLLFSTMKLLMIKRKKGTEITGQWPSWLG
jgi:hypothetical protein